MRMHNTTKTMDANAQLSLLELLDALPDTAEKDVTEFVRKAFEARRGTRQDDNPRHKAPSSHITDYNRFTRTMMPAVRKDFPGATPQEHMRIVAKAWRARKASATSSQS